MSCRPLLAFSHCIAPQEIVGCSARGNLFSIITSCRRRARNVNFQPSHRARPHAARPVNFPLVPKLHFWERHCGRNSERTGCPRACAPPAPPRRDSRRGKCNFPPHCITKRSLVTRGEMKAIGRPHQHACFHCRKSFKRPQFVGSSNRMMTSEQLRGQSIEASEFEANREYKCPDCGGPAFFMGIDFKAPRKSDVKAWKKVQKFIESGKTFYRSVKFEE